MLLSDYKFILSNFLYATFMVVYLPLKYISYKFKKDNGGWRKYELCNIYIMNNKFVKENNKLENAKRLSVILMFFTIYLISSFINTYFYLIATLLWMGYFLFDVIKKPNGRILEFDCIIILMFVGSIVSLLVAHFELLNCVLVFLLLGIILVIPQYYLFRYKEVKGKTYQYLCFWWLTVSCIAFFMFFAFGIVDINYLETLGCERYKIPLETNFLNVAVWLSMIGYQQILMYFQLEIQDKIELMASEAGLMFFLQMVIILNVAFSMLLCIPDVLRKIYADFK